MAVNETRKTRLESWRLEYKNWQTSGLTKQAYCATIGVRYHTFKSRLRTLRKAELIGSPKQHDQGKGGAGFMPIHMTAPGIYKVGVDAQAAKDILLPKATPSNTAYCVVEIRGSGRIIIETEKGFEWIVHSLRSFCLGEHV